VTTVGANRRPTVEVSVTDNLTEGSELDFEATTSDADGDEVTVTWYLQPEASNVSTTCIDIVTGDASPFVCPWPVFVGPTVTRQYTKDGDYLGRVVVQDGRGAYTEQRFAFRVRNVAPEVTVNTPVAVTEESTATISGQFSDVGTEATRVTIDWGDGSPTSSQVYPCSFAVAADGSCEHGIFATAAPGSTSWFRTHVYEDPRPGGQPYTVTVTVTDGVDTVVRTVQQPVAPLPLTVENLVATDASEGGTMQVTGQIRNPSLDPLVLFVDFGDGTSPINLGYPCAPNSVCPFSPTPPDPIFVCSDPCTLVWFSFNVPVTDDPAGQSETRIVTAKVRKEITGFLDTVTDSATISNVAPTLTVDPVSSAVAGAATVVSGSVSDPGTDTGTLNVDWGDGNTSSVNHSLDGTFELHHAYGTPGLRTVSLQAVDDDLAPSAAVTRSADVTPAVNQAPVAAAPAAPLAVSEDGTLPIDLRDFIVSDDLTAVDDLQVAVTDPLHGSLSGTGFLRTYTPASDYHGPESFDLTVTDGGSPTGCSPVGAYCLATAASTVTVPIAVASVNDVPVVELSGPSGAAEGDTAEFPFSVADVDSGDGIAPGSVAVNCGAAGTLVAASLEVGVSDGSFACTFPDGSAPSIVSVSLTDLAGDPGFDTIAVVVANVAPSLQVTATPSSLLVLPGEVVSLAGSFSDPGADLGIVTVTWGDGATTVLPPQAPGAFQANHLYSGAGTYSMSVTVSDGEDNASHTDDVVVAVGAAAIEAIADRLGDAPTGGLTLLQRRALQRAIARLVGDPSSLGAAEQLDSNPVAALDKIRTAVEQLATVPLEVAATASIRLAELSRTVAVNAVTSAKQRTGCTSYALATCSGKEARALRSADAALAAGDVALAAGASLTAIGKYRDATAGAVGA
jgi:Bacterial Ig domain/PKD domain